MVQRSECLQNNLKNLKALFVFISLISQISMGKIYPLAFLEGLLMYMLKMPTSA